MNSISEFADGEQRRDSALSLLRVRRTDIIRECTAAALHVALESGEVSADDVREIVQIPFDISPKLVGVVFRDLADAKIITRVGYRKTRRAIAHARPLTVWQLVDREAAVAWLRAHPPINPE